MKRREDLSTPRRGRRFGVHYDPEAFGNFSEGIARFLGTGRYLVFQTVVIVAWIVWNSLAFIPDWARFDPWGRGLVLLTLVLSLQASYAAPLILLAQNRQEARDRDTTTRDREAYARTQADTEFLAREVASIRLSMSDVATTSDLEEHLEKLAKAIDRLHDRLDAYGVSPPPRDDPPPR